MVVIALKPAEFAPAIGPAVERAVAAPAAAALAAEHVDEPPLAVALLLPAAAPVDVPVVALDAAALDADALVAAVVVVVGRASQAAVDGAPTIGTIVAGSSSVAGSESAFVFYETGEALHFLSIANCVDQLLCCERKHCVRILFLSRSRSHLVRPSDVS